MIRTFTTHNVRKQQELTGSLWEFTPCQGEYEGRTFQVATPCCWENLPDFSDYRGEGIFRTKFYAGGTIRLEFKGVSHTACVTLDGKEIASHYNAYTAFSVIVKDLGEGEHTLAIRADNRFGSGSALHIPNDYMYFTSDSFTSRRIWQTENGWQRRKSRLSISLKKTRLWMSASRSRTEHIDGRR